MNLSCWYVGIHSTIFQFFSFVGKFTIKLEITKISLQEKQLKIAQFIHPTAHSVNREPLFGAGDRTVTDD